MSTTELTQQQIDRQDFVNDAIYGLLSELAGKELDYEDMHDLIGSVRGFISAEFNDLGIMPEKEFYPWIGCDDEDGK